MKKFFGINSNSCNIDKKTSSDIEKKSSSATDSRSGILSVILLIWALAGVLIPNVWLSLVDDLPLLPALTNVLLPAGVYLLLLTLSRRIGVTSLFFVILFVFAAFQIVLLYMYGRSVIAVDMFLNVVTTNSSEIGELLGNLSTIIGIIIAVYLPPIVIAIITLVKKERLPYKVLFISRRAAIMALAGGLVMLGCCFLFGKGKYKIYCDLYPVNIGYNLREAVRRTAKVAAYPDHVKDLVYPASSSRPDSLPETYVLVIGETLRADNWQLNGYGRETTPRLVNEQGLVNFPKVLSQSNTTHKSVPMLLSHLNAENFGDSIYHVKSIISAFKNAGFETSFFSAQRRNRSFIDFFGEEADTCIFIRENLKGKNVIYDSDLLGYLDSALKSGNPKKLIVLHTYGSHFNYIDRYPASEARFEPDGPAEATYESRGLQMNAYDNTVLFTSNLLADIMSRLKSQAGPAAMIYTSDHGEDLYDDDRKLFLHASPKPSYYQIRVPFVVWLNSAYRDNYDEKYRNLIGNSSEFVSSSDAFYHTAIDLAGLNTPYYNKRESLSSRNYSPSAPIYLTDHNKAVPVLESGLQKQDFEKLDSLGVAY